MNPAAALFLPVVASVAAGQVETSDRLASLADVAAAAALCLEYVELPGDEGRLRLEQSGWRNPVPVIGLYSHPTNGARVVPGPQAGFCAVEGLLSLRLAPEALAGLMDQLGGRQIDGTPERGVWDVRGHMVRAWVSRDVQQPAVSLIVGTFAMEKK